MTWPPTRCDHDLVPARAEAHDGRVGIAFTQAENKIYSAMAAPEWCRPRIVWSTVDSKDEQGADVPSEANDDSVNGSDTTEPPVRRGWLRSPRTLVAAGVAVALLVAGGVFLLSTEESPAVVVQEYLEAIRSGDTDAAMNIAYNLKTSGPSSDELFRSARALADDWRVDKVVERNQTDDSAEVDVTISAGGDSERGRFTLAKDNDGWTIEQPFVEVTLDPGELLGMVELGDVTVPRDRLESGAPGVVRVQVFPGAYRLYPTLADRVTIEPTHLLALPHEEPRSPVAVSGELTKQGTDLARQTFNDHLDNCVKQTVVSPSHCPFSAATGGGAIRTEATIDDDSYTEVRDVSWKIIAYPEVSFAPEAGHFMTVLREPGTIRLTATGIPGNGNESGRVGFTADCGVLLDNVRVVPTQNGFTIAPGNVIGVQISDARCRRPIG